MKVGEFYQFGDHANAPVYEVLSVTDSGKTCVVRVVGNSKKVQVSCSLFDYAILLQGFNTKLYKAMK
jgi:hypothetical protein